MIRRNHIVPIIRLIVVLMIAISVPLSGFAQTPGGTVIQNAASATYSDGTNTFSTVSNTVTVTVANVAGLVITPDAGTQPSVVAGQTNVNFTFRVTNTGNFADRVRFLASGASLQLTGPAVITAAVIDVDGSGTINAGDTNILTNGADVLSALLAQNGFVDVIAVTSINPGAVSGNTIVVTLGDATTGGPSFDNQPANSSANEVRTVSGASVNGLREARGSQSASVDNDAQLQLSLTAPTGPVALGSNISYVWQLCNTGNRPADAITLVNAPVGSNTGVFIFAPIPVGTVLMSPQVFPAGTLYTTSPLSTSPLAATWTTTAPVPLSSLTRIGFNVGASIASGGTCAANVNMIVTITTTNATIPIFEIGDSFANNSIGTLLTDQSGDLSQNAGDGNANFNEGNQPGNTDGDGIIQQTTLLVIGSVLIGPVGQPGAVGPTNNNDDYTNRSVTAGIAGVPPGGTTTAANTLIFTNTVQNTGNANDTYALTVPTLPVGFTVEVSIDNGASYTTLQPGNGSVNLSVAFGGSANILVRVTAPIGLSVLTPYAVVVRATSNTTPASANDTIDRIYTGFIRLDKTVSVTNSTGVGGPTDAVPGAQITYTITYTNISSTGGTGNVALTATNIVITENGNSAPNNWATTTTHVVGATDTGGGVITGDSAGSTLLTDTIGSLGPAQAGVFTFRRLIN
ncbi:MAG: hypothetical protein ND895_14490 [Pyrinomonadaceae bacterium]|nr:hypothetical protein [Pyrinomonadaceae bacterium]